jgi:hypothetical protein
MRNTIATVLQVGGIIGLIVCAFVWSTLAGCATIAVVALVAGVVLDPTVKL